MKIKSFYISSFFASASVVFGLLLMPSPASAINCPSGPDGSLQCGSNATYTMEFKCTLSGPDLTFQGATQIRILAGQACGFGNAGDEAGYYTNNIGGTTPYSSLGGGTPPGWSYNKSGTINERSSLPSGEFVDPLSPQWNSRYYGGNVGIIFGSPDDAAEITVNGVKTELLGGCYGGYPTSVAGPGCSTISNGISLAGTPGASIGAKIRNTYRPNNGSGTWGSGDVTMYMSIDSCYSAAYLSYLAANGYPYTRIANYHPTSQGVCTPESTLDAKWQENGSSSITKTLNSGQTSITIPFDYINTGPNGGQINITGCSAHLVSGNAQSPSNPTCSGTISP